MKDSIVYKVIFPISLVLTGALLGIVYKNIITRIELTETKANVLQEKYNEIDKQTGEALIRIDNRLNNIEKGIGVTIASPSVYIEQLKRELAVPTKEI